MGSADMYTDDLFAPMAELGDGGLRKMDAYMLP